MSGYLDAAVMGVALTEPQLKTSAKGAAWVRVLLVVGDGDGKQFAWVCAFGETAEKVAAGLRKGGRLYAEGALSSEIYMRDGKPTVSLSVAARRAEVLNQIGKARPKQDRRQDDRHGDDRERSGYDTSSRHHAMDDGRRPLDDGFSNHEAMRR